MKELSKKEELSLYAGGGITASFINAIAKGVSLVVDLGRYLGSSLRRLFSNNICE